MKEPWHYSVQSHCIFQLTYMFGKLSLLRAHSRDISVSSCMGICFKRRGKERDWRWRSSSKKSVSRYFWCLQRHLWAAKFEFNIRFWREKIIKFKFIIEFKFSRSQVALQASKISGYTLLTWTSPNTFSPITSHYWIKVLFRNIHTKISRHFVLKKGFTVGEWNK